MSLADIDLISFAQQLSDLMEQRLVAAGLPQEEVLDNTDVLRRFTQVVVGELQNEPGIEMPGATHAIPWDEKTATQGMTLFTEGIYMAMVKCYALGIPSPIKRELLQEFALEVYNQAKQVVASTYGQEHTPEFQLSHDQQVALINQASDSALMYCISKYEQARGPIETVPPAVTPRPMQALVLEQTAPQPVAAVPTPVQPAQPVRPKGPTPHDKYGAVAMLLTTLPSSQRANILQNFNPEEKELISFYSYPQHIEQNLDVSCVHGHLKRFKSLFQQGSGGASLKSQGHHGLARLAEQYPLEKLLSYVKDERPVIREYLEAIYQPAKAHALAPVAPIRHFSDLLPARIEDILYHHLQRRLEQRA